MINLEIKNLTLTVAKKTLCKNLHLHIKPGDIWGILGPNGSGKSTLLQTLAGLLPADGEIYLQGKRLSSIPRKVIARQMGILLQESMDVFPQTVYEYCMSGRYPYLSYFGIPTSEDKKILQQALTDMELITLARQNVRTLSGGEKQRLNIAALLTQSPFLYLLDEPTNHLDLRHQITVLRHFQTMCQSQRAAVCLSLHDVNLAAQFCDKIILLKGDNTFLAGKACDLLTEENLSHLYRHPLVRRSGIHAG